MKKSILIFVSLTFIFGCAKKEVSNDAETEQIEQIEQIEQTEQGEQVSSPRDKIVIDEKDFVNKEIDKIDLSGYLSQFRQNAQNSAHSVYLNDEVEFSSLPPTPDFEKTLVAGNDLCILLNELPEEEEPFDVIHNGIKIPKGTLLKCTGEKIKSGNESRDGLFLFEGNYNYLGA